MGVLDKIFGSKKDKSIETVEAPPCPHATLMPRWDSAADMGHEDRATSFVCEACHTTFTQEETRLLRETSVTDRLLHQEAAERA